MKFFSFSRRVLVPAVPIRAEVLADLAADPGPSRYCRGVPLPVVGRRFRVPESPFLGLEFLRRLRRRV